MNDFFIPVKTRLRRDPRLERLSRTVTNCPGGVTHCLGALLTLWLIADEFANENDQLSGFTLEDINERVGIPGFVEALPADWAVVENGVVRLPDFSKNNSNSTRKRALATARKAAQREREKGIPASENSSDSADVTHGHASSRDVPKSHGRAEHNRTEAEAGSTGALPTAKKRTKRKPKRIYPIQFDREGNSWIGITESHRVTWAKDYPACDIHSELTRAAEWLIRKDEVRDNYLAFLKNWFKKCAESGGTRSKANNNKVDTRNVLTPEQVRNIPERVAPPIVRQIGGQS